MELRDARFVTSATRFADLPAPAFPEVAFAGRSNVGKSSLINALVERRKLVRTSNTPGATRTINLFRLELKEPDAVVDLVDLPGYGWARRSKKERKSWGTLIEDFLDKRVGLKAVILIADARRGFEDDDLQLVEFLQHVQVPPILVATKLDKLPSSKRKPAVARLQKQMGGRVHGFSAPTGEGRDPLWRTILRACGLSEEEGAGVSDVGP